MFTNEDPGQSGLLSDLITHIANDYRRNVDVVAASAAQDFIDFARDYLKQHRPSEVFPVDDNYGILLTNGVRIKLCPTSDTESEVTGGDMANPDTSIPVTRQR